MNTKLSFVGTPAQVFAATRSHWTDLGLDAAPIDALEATLSLKGSFAHAQAGNVRLEGHTNDSPPLVDLYVPDADAHLWRSPLASAETMVVHATRGDLTVPVLEGAGLPRPQTPRYVTAGHVLPVEVPNGDFPTPDAWVQPTGAHDAYSVGAIVQHGATRWVSLTPANTWAPGVSGWREVVAEGQIPAWVQPTGAHDAYPMGARVTHNGRVWENTGSAANVWEPGVFGWTDEGPI